jgi:hypothetical protein
MVPVIARTSNQPRIAATKRRIHAALLEVRLFNDDPRAVFRALGDALRYNAIYLRLSLVPLMWMAVPLLLIVVHLHPFYGYAGLEPGAAALVKVQLREDAANTAVERLALEAPTAVRIETPAVRLAGSNEVLWRIVPEAPGGYVLTIRVGEDAVSKSLHVSSGVTRRSPSRLGPAIVDQLLYPSEPPLDGNGPVASIEITYRETGIDVLGWRVHWTIVYAVLSIVAAFILARWRGITI